MAKKEIANSNLRNVFVEGQPDRYQKAKELIEEIIKEHRKVRGSLMHSGETNPI